MAKSMTGFGKAEIKTEFRKICIELRSLNSKQIDISLRLPGIYREMEMDIRNILTSRMVRGKVDMIITYEEDVVSEVNNINRELVAGYYKQACSIADELKLNIPEDVLSTLLRMPDVFKSEKSEITAQEKALFMECLNTAICELDNFRIQEGKALLSDMLNRVDYIEDALGKIQPFEQSRMDDIKQRIRHNLSSTVEEARIDINRFEQELVYYIEKIDITEEKVRLKNHCAYFKDVVCEDDNPGRKLGFIAQEMGREINTLGSKANNSNIQKIIVGMKDELEKIKEQILNVL